LAQSAADAFGFVDLVFFFIFTANGFDRTDRDALPASGAFGIDKKFAALFDTVAIGACRADGDADSATDAALVVDDGQVINHLDRLDRAFFYTESAADASFGAIILDGFAFVPG